MLRVDVVGLNNIATVTNLDVNKILYDFVTFDNYLDFIGFLYVATNFGVYTICKFQSNNNIIHFPPL